LKKKTSLQRKAQKNIHQFIFLLAHQTQKFRSTPCQKVFLQTENGVDREKVFSARLIKKQHAVFIFPWVENVQRYQKAHTLAKPHCLSRLGKECSPDENDAA